MAERAGTPSPPDRKVNVREIYFISYLTVCLKNNSLVE
jgi:hypothetical protein